MRRVTLTLTLTLTLALARTLTRTLTLTLTRCDACVVVTTRSPKFFPTTTARPAHHRVVSLRQVAEGTPRAGAIFTRAWEELERDRAGQRVGPSRCGASQPPPLFGEEALGAIPSWNRKDLERAQRRQSTSGRL